MNGWWRIWAVLSVLAGALIFTISYNEDKQITAWLDLSIPEAIPVKQDRWNNIFRQFVAADADVAACITSTVKMEIQPGFRAVDLHCDKKPWPRFVDALREAILPGAVLGAIWLAVGWIYQGFRPKK